MTKYSVFIPRANVNMTSPNATLNEFSVRQHTHTQTLLAGSLHAHNTSTTYSNRRITTSSPQSLAITCVCCYRVRSRCTSGVSSLSAPVPRTPGRTTSSMMEEATFVAAHELSRLHELKVHTKFVDLSIVKRRKKKKSTITTLTTRGLCPGGFVIWASPTIVRPGPHR